MLFNLTLQATEKIGVTDRLHDERRFMESKTTLLGALEDALKHPNSERRLAYILASLGSVAQDEGKYLQAEKYYRRSLAYWRDGGENSRAGLARTLNNLASLLDSVGRLSEAQELLRRSESILLESDPETGVMLLNRGTTYFRQRKYAEAEAAYRRAWVVLEPHRSSRELQLARIAGDLGLTCEKTGRKEEARSYYTFARTTWEKSLRSGEATAEIFFNLAGLYSILRQNVAAKLVLEQGLVVACRELGADHPRVADMLFLYARVLRQTGSKAEAGRMTKRAEAIRVQTQEHLARYTINAADLAGKNQHK
jgi:tetratricopeptide (TPR) repeat protein